MLVDLALPRSPSDAPLTPNLEWNGPGRATFVGWGSEATQRRAAEWSALPKSLSQRARVSAPLGAASRVARPALWLAAAGALLAVAARARWALWCALGVTSATVVVSVALPPARPWRRVIELEALGVTALAVDCARDQLRGARDDDLRWECEPNSASLRATSLRNRRELELAGRGALLRRWSRLATDGRRLDGDANAWGLLAPVWRRSRSGEWRRFAAWPSGVALPETGGEASTGPPGWINPALPAGTEIVIGRWDEPAVAPVGVEAEVWVRWIGP